MNRYYLLLICVCLPLIALSQSFTIKTEEASATSAAILITDSSGRIIRTFRQLQLLDTSTRKCICKYTYAVDTFGKPIPQQVPAGTFDIALSPETPTLLRHVSILPNRKNIITGLVAKGKLRFRYEDNMQRPITEFEAKVTLSDSPYFTIIHPCRDELPYDGGNYMIEVNTLPVARFRTDIDWNFITEVQIKEQGSLRIVSKGFLGTISLYRILQKKFIKFHELNVTGNKATPQLELMPGIYEARWPNKHGKVNGAENIIRFRVEPNNVTSLVMKK